MLARQQLCKIATSVGLWMASTIDDRPHPPSKDVITFPELIIGTHEGLTYRQVRYRTTQ